MCIATLDTQTAGDVLRPAAYTGVTGFKPSIGAISVAGVIPVAWSVDTIGVTTRSVEDAGLLFRVLAGSAGRRPPPIRERLQRPPRLGVLRRYVTDHADADAVARTEVVAERLHQAGAELCELVPPLDLEQVHAAHRVIVMAECAALHEEEFTRRPQDFGPRVRELIELGLLTPASVYLRAQRLRSRFQREMQEVLATVDALLSPTAPSAAPERDTTGNPVLNIPWTLGGFPAITLPAGLNDASLPLGVQLVAARGADTHLLAVARWCERVLRSG